MLEVYTSILSTPAEADKIGRFGRYRYIGETQISVRPTYRSVSNRYFSNLQRMTERMNKY